MSIMYCSECGKEVSDRAAACPHCGNPLQGMEQMPIAPAAPGKKSHPVLIFLGVAAVAVVLLVILGIVVLLANKPAAKAQFVATDNVTDENCTQLTDYCINVNCTFQNQGQAAGVRRVRAQLIDKSTQEVRADHDSDLTLLPNATQRLTFSFPEAEIDWQVSSMCRVDPEQ